MKKRSFIISAFIASSLFFTSAANAQETVNENKTVTEKIGALKISDISGQWKIEVIGNPNSSFKGSARIPYADGRSVIAEVIAEDKCCRGLNHARVLQESLITIEDDGKITVTSEIKEYLLLIEGVEAEYFPDDFELKQVDRDTLIGRLNGGTAVRWVRDIEKLS